MLSSNLIRVAFEAGFSTENENWARDRAVSGEKYELPFGYTDAELDRALFMAAVAMTHYEHSHPRVWKTHNWADTCISMARGVVFEGLDPDTNLARALKANRIKKAKK